MQQDLKIYCDSGANIKQLDREIPNVVFYHFAYDNHKNWRPEKQTRAVPSQARWKNIKHPWEELGDATWEDFDGGDHLLEITEIVGHNNPEDILHLDSAYKTGCSIFLTSDSGHIVKNKDRLESLIGIRIFNPNTEEGRKNLLDYIAKIKKKITEEIE